MEAVSAAASVTGLICFAAQAAQTAAKLHGFLTTIAEAPQEIQNLSRDLLHLHDLLSGIANFSLKLEKTTFVDDAILLDIEGCTNDLKNLEKIVQRVQSGSHDPGITGKGRRAWNRVKWAYWESDVKKSMDRLASHKQTISLALSSLGRSLDIQAMMSMKSLQDSVSRVIESQEKNSSKALIISEQLNQFGKTSESIRRSLGTISHHIQNSSTTALHENLITMIRSEITSGVQEALFSTFSGMNNFSNPPPYLNSFNSNSHLPSKPELESVVAGDISSLGDTTGPFFNSDERDGVCGTQLPYQKPQPPSSTLNLRDRKYRRYETIFGVLLVFISSETTQQNIFSRTFHQQKDIFEAGFTFIPAPWLFKTAFAASFVKHVNQNGESSISTNLSYYAVVPDNAKIMEFSRAGDVKGIQQLFAQRLATPRDRDTHGRTPLHWAASLGNYETCKFLLENGADPCATNDVSRTPLHWTTLLSCNTDIVSLLISHGCDPSIPNISGQNALFGHNTQGRMKELVQAIVHQDHFIVDLDHIDYLGRTPLMWEVYEMNDSTDSSTALIQNGASVTRKDDRGLTALHHALLCSTPEYKKKTIKLLLKSGADPLARSDDKITPTDIAKHRGVLEQWKGTLSECGFNLDKIGRGNLEEAISTATDSIILSLHINAPRPSGVKRRHAAISQDNNDPVKMKTPESSRDYKFSIDQIPRRIQYGLFKPSGLTYSQASQPSLPNYPQSPPNPMGLYNAELIQQIALPYDAAYRGPTHNQYSSPSIACWSKAYNSASVNQQAIMFQTQSRTQRGSPYSALQSYHQSINPYDNTYGGDTRTTTPATQTTIPYGNYFDRGLSNDHAPGSYNLFD